MAIRDLSRSHLADRQISISIRSQRSDVVGKSGRRLHLDEKVIAIFSDRTVSSGASCCRAVANNKKSGVRPTPGNLLFQEA